GDPSVVYDQLADRWLITQFAVSGANGSSIPYLECIAISTSGDPTGSYYRYSFPRSFFPDYPKLGLWPDAYYMSTNDFSGNTFADSAKSTLTGPTSTPVAGYTELCNGGTCVPQAGTTQLLDSLADRVMYRLAYRNFGDHESLVVNHSVAPTAGGGRVRWYEIRSPGATPTVYQQSTFAPDTRYRWMGSAPMD